jgi:aldehyde:ferredoxin oxidoreductase
MGANLGIDHLEGVVYACYLCDILGLDTMSTGGVIGFAMEAIERGHLAPADFEGIDLRFGDYRAVHRVIEMIAYREGIGDQMAEGVRRFSGQVGHDSYQYAMHTKGLEMPGYEPRGLPGHGLGYMTGDKGGEHVQGYMVGYETGLTWRGRDFPRFGIENKAECLINVQNYQAGTNTLVKCDFTKSSTEEAGGIKPEGFAAMLGAATGRQIQGSDLLRVGERIWNLTRLFNLREGFTRADDRLPYRCQEQGLPDPEFAGRRVSRKDQDYMLDDYYRLRGWDDQGIPTSSKLTELGLAEQGRELGIV